MKHRHKKGWLFFSVKTCLTLLNHRFLGVKDLHRGEWGEGVTWATFFYAEGPAVCSFNDIQCLAHNHWGARLRWLVSTLTQPQRHPLASHILSSSLPFGQKWNLYTTHLAGWRSRQVRHHRLLWTRPEKSNDSSQEDAQHKELPLGVTNGRKREPIEEDTKFTSPALHICPTRNSQRKKRLWLWRWLTPNDRWLLMPQPSTESFWILASAGYMFNPKPRIEAPKVK